MLILLIPIKFLIFKFNHLAVFYIHSWLHHKLIFIGWYTYNLAAFFSSTIVTEFAKTGLIAHDRKFDFITQTQSCTIGHRQPE